MESASLEWVIVDGVPRHVSAFAGILPKRRPRAFCPHCARRLTLKLGDLRRHHAAHEAGQVCAATHPETALHINTKLALAAALSAASGEDARLSITRSCAGVVGPCEQMLTREWLRGWTDVLVEHRVGDERRPDIVLARAGVTVGAIEVFVSHAVSPDKARTLAELGVQWIEVRANEQLATPGAWTPGAPIAVLHASDEHEWRCDIHRELHAQMLAASESAKLADREAARHAAVLVAARVIDMYHAGGARERFIYRVRELTTDGRAHTMQLQRGGLELATAELSADRKEAWTHLRPALDTDIEGLLRGADSFYDSPMRWAQGAAAENIVDEALTDRVAYDPTPLATRFPRRWFYDAERARWFLPPDMRDVRWDRGPDDLFAAHPAWTRARSAVRERPAPEDSWATPVFASRPIASVFRDCVRDTRRHDAIVVVDLIPSDTSPPRAIAVIERPASESAIADLASSLEAEGTACVWISHPADWLPALGAVAWAPAGRDSRGRGGVVIDGIGIFRADQFARAFAKGDPRLDPAAIRRQMASRVDRLQAR